MEIVAIMEDVFHERAHTHISHHTEDLEFPIIYITLLFRVMAHFSLKLNEK